MNLKLVRHDFTKDGIFGELFDENDMDKVYAVTLEHAYDDGNGNIVPKVAAGIYNCVRHPPNRLPYETFMLENVPDFQGQPVSGILIHIGNYQRDVIGCIAVGISKNLLSNPPMISGSKVAFGQLMDLQKGLNNFQLEILNE